jgi:hypothetical protein
MNCRIKSGNDEERNERKDITKEKKGSGTPTDAYSYRPHLTDAAACSAEHARLSAFHH